MGELNVKPTINYYESILAIYCTFKVGNNFISSSSYVLDVCNGMNINQAFV